MKTICKHKTALPPGFTLIELLVVIAIIGVLASIVLSSLQMFRMKGKDAKRQGDLHAITSAMAACYDDEACGGDPNQKDYWTCPATNSLDATAPCDGTSGGTTTGWNFAIGHHLSEMPRDPANSGSSVYTWINNNTVYGGNSVERAGQWYCVYGASEAVSGSYFLATPRGLRKVTTLPINLNCLEL